MKWIVILRRLARFQNLERFTAASFEFLCEPVGGR